MTVWNPIAEIVRGHNKDLMEAAVAWNAGNYASALLSGSVNTLIATTPQP